MDVKLSRLPICIGLNEHVTQAMPLRFKSGAKSNDGIVMVILSLQGITFSATSARPDP